MLFRSKLTCSGRGVGSSTTSDRLSADHRLRGGWACGIGRGRNRPRRDLPDGFRNCLLGRRFLAACAGHYWFPNQLLGPHIAGILTVQTEGSGHLLLSLARGHAGSFASTSSDSDSLAKSRSC